MRFLICFAIGLVIALIITAIMKSQLKSVKSVDSAHNYIDEDSFKLLIADEIFLYDETTKTARPQERDHDDR